MVRLALVRSRVLRVCCCLSTPNCHPVLASCWCVARPMCCRCFSAPATACCCGGCAGPPTWHAELAPRSGAAAAELVSRITEEQGLLPEVVWRDRALLIALRNCSFHELSGADPDLVCAMHRSFLEGALEVVTAGLGPLRIEPDDCRISCGGERCEMLCTFPRAGNESPGAGR